MTATMKRIMLSLALLACMCGVSAQQVNVEAKIDSIMLLVGEQAHLTLEVTAKPGAKVEFPEYERTQYMVPGVEVIGTRADTSSLDGNMVVRHIYTLTSFDESMYAIPGLKVKVNGKDYVSNHLALKVVTCDVDTLHPEKFYPPKGVQDNPFQWAEWRMVFWCSILASMLFVVLVYFAVRLKRNKPVIVRLRRVKHVPPHTKALDAIERIKGDRTLVENDPKEYYTRLTDTLRKYINERFGFNAMEMTSSEILERLNTLGNEQVMEELREVFTTSDLVKFAKYSALLNENDMNLVNAVRFIDSTKAEEKTQEQTVMEKLSDEEAQTAGRRKALTLVMAVTATALVALTAYIIYKVYMLLS